MPPNHSPRRILAVFVSCLSLIACSTTIDGITLMSTRNVELGGEHESLGDRVGTTDRRLWIAFIPLGPEPSPKRALTQVLEDNQADYLRNASFQVGGWSLIALSYGWVSVEGDPWRARARSVGTR